MRPLSPAERHLMGALLRDPDAKNEVLAARQGVSVKTVEARFTSIYAKLGVSSRPGALMKYRDLLEARRHRRVRTDPVSEPMGL